MTVSYLMDLAGQAGIAGELVNIADIGWDQERHCFVDGQDRPMRSIFKLCPWEWLLRDRFAEQWFASYTLTQWLEPIWKDVALEQRHPADSVGALSAPPEFAGVLLWRTAADELLR